MTTLSDLFLDKCSKYCDKWEHYFAVYERELYRFVHRNQEVALLEVGVQNGGSLELWSDFLPAGSTITGIDINPEVGLLKFESPHVKAFAIDATDADALDGLFGSQSFDIIIDDGSHTSADIIKSFELLYNRLKPGGVYIIEDLHCSYRREFQGGYLYEGSSIEWLKRIVDVVNCDHIIAEEIDQETHYSYRLLSQSIASVSFYDSICVIDKFKLEKSRPFKRLINGEVGEIEPLVANLIDKSPRYVFETVLFGRAALRQANARMLATLQRQNESVQTLEERLTWVLREAQERIEALTAENTQSAQNLRTAQEEAETLRHQRKEWVGEGGGLQRRDVLLGALRRENMMLQSALADKDALIRALNAGITLPPTGVDPADPANQH